MELRSRKFHPSPTTEVEEGHRCQHRDTDRMDVEVPQADTRSECRHPQQVCSIFNAYPGLLAVVNSGASIHYLFQSKSNSGK